LNYTSSLICSFPVFENYRSRANVPSLRLESASQLAVRFEEELVALYSKVLEFQARSLCYLRKHPVTQFFKDMFKQDGWDSLVKDMKESEGSIRRFKEDIDGEKLHAGFDGLQASARIEKVNKCLQMLYTCPYEDRKDRNNERVPGTCDWFTDDSRFKNWNEGKTSSLLWVSADPGCGKSVLARYLVDKILPSTSNRTTCYFFFKDDFDDQKSAANAICALLRQLFERKPHLLRDSILKKIDTDGLKWVESIGGLWSTLESVAADQDAGEIVCILDALDECRDTDRSQLIKAISNFYVADSNKLSLKFMLTSRPHQHIRLELWEVLDRLPTIHLSGEDQDEVENISREIDLVIKSRVDDIGRKKPLEPDECTFLQTLLTSVPNRNYLWVNLTLNVIEKTPGFTKGEVRKKIKEIPETIDRAYSKILDRSPDPGKAKRLLHIITAARRPLSLKEMSLALTIEESYKSYEDIEENLELETRFRVTVRELCGLFVTIIDAKIYLLHQTAKEFLVRNESLTSSKATSPPDSQNFEWKHSLQSRESNRILAEICIWYLTLDFVETRLTVLLNYSAHYWAAHFREAGIRSEEAIVALARSLCETGSKRYKAWSAIYASNAYVFPKSASSLTIASYFGLNAVVKLLLETGKVDVDSKDADGQTPLSWAAEEGHEAVVKLLHETGKADVDLKDADGQTPLWWAAEAGHEAVVKLLLETGKVNVDSKDTDGQTSLSLAAREGHEAVVKLLLETGKADVDSKDIGGRTPLSLAAERGHEAAAKLLQLSTK
jgi:ankyrin repeat domain-containing protein 50